MWKEGTVEESVKEKALNQIAKHGISVVCAEFDGYRDEGRISKLEAGNVTVEESRMVKDVIRDVLDSAYPTWDMGEGSGGTVQIDVPNKKISINIEFASYWVE